MISLNRVRTIGDDRINTETVFDYLVATLNNVHEGIALYQRRHNNFGHIDPVLGTCS